MNEKELQKKIEASIKTKTIREYLLSCHENLCTLNALNSPPNINLIEKASQRFEGKIKCCQQIESDLPNPAISSREDMRLSGKLDVFRLKLAMLYADGKQSEITHENYNEIKILPLKILSVENIELKLKYFDLVIALLEKALDDSYGNKEFVGAFDLLKLCINEPNDHPNLQDLHYINNLGCQTKDDGIRKMFYGVIREINKKLLFQDLLNQLLNIVKNSNNTPFVQFTIIFITKFLNDPDMQTADVNQMIGLVFQSLKHYHMLMKKNFNSIRKIFNKKNVSDYLVEFEKDFIEKTSEQLIYEPIKLDLFNFKLNILIHNTQELDISIYFPPYINNEKIRAKFDESKKDFIEKLEEKIVHSDLLMLEHIKNGFVRMSSKANELIESALALASDAKDDVEKVAQTSSDTFTLKGFLKKNSGSILGENEKIDKNNLKNLLIQAKKKLLPIQKKLSSWALILNFSIDQQHDKYHNQMDTSQLDYAEFVMAHDTSTDEKYSSLIQQILDKFEENNATIKTKDDWFAKPEIHKPSLAYKIFNRGYFNIDFSIKKIKARLGDALSFDDINNFIFKQGFWTLLLKYGIVCWRLTDKAAFSRTWAEQLCLPKTIIQIEELKTQLLNNSSDELLKKVIALLDTFTPYKNDAVLQVFDDFKKFIAIQFGQLKAFEQEFEGRIQEIDSRLNENENYSISLKAKPASFFSTFKKASEGVIAHVALLH